jgi:hypothetical protein
VVEDEDERARGGHEMGAAGLDATEEEAERDADDGPDEPLRGRALPPQNHVAQPQDSHLRRHRAHPRKCAPQTQTARLGQLPFI